MKKDNYGMPMPKYYNRKLYRRGNATRVAFHCESKAISMPLVELDYIERLEMTVYVDADGWLYLIDNNGTCVYTCTRKSTMNEVVKAYMAF